MESNLLIGKKQENKSIFLHVLIHYFFISLMICDWCSLNSRSFVSLTHTHSNIHVYDIQNIVIVNCVLKWHNKRSRLYVSILVRPNAISNFHCFALLKCFGQSSVSNSHWHSKRSVIRINFIALFQSNTTSPCWYLTFPQESFREAISWITRCTVIG